MSYQSKFTGEEIDQAVNEAKALIGKSVVVCSKQDPSEGDVLTFKDGEPRWVAPERDEKVASYSGDISAYPSCVDDEDRSIFGGSYMRGTQWARIDDVWTREELIGAVVETCSDSGNWHTYTLTEDMVYVEQRDGGDSIIRVAIDLNGMNDLVCVNTDDHPTIPAGLYQCALSPTTITKKSATGVTNWNDLQGRPVVVEAGSDTLDWTYYNMNHLVAYSGSYLKVSDVILTLEQFPETATIVLDGETLPVKAVQYNADTLMLTLEDGSPVALVAQTANAGWQQNGYAPMPEVGFYIGAWMGAVTITIPGYGGFAAEKLDPAYLYQPDWAQKDEAAPDFVKNKPFYSEVKEVLPETTLAIDQSNLSVDMKARLDIVDGGTYTVNWNGTEYVCVAKDVEQFGVVSTLLGNYAHNMGTGDTGEPFMIAVYDEETAAQYGGYATCIYAFDGSASVTLSVMGEVVKKLDPKYLPDIEGAVMDVLLALGLAPVLLDADGSVLTENDGTLLLI